jgi:SUMO ligase MMS21 Smc5/6 complex component
LKEEDLPSSYIVDFDLIPSPQPIENNVVHIQISFENHDQSCDIVNNKFHLPPLEIISPSCNQLTEIHSRIRKGYKPLKLSIYPP